uniref:triacylglycerol lipase n=1 Tax=Ornithodoros turicata TaxID=34597 RepID=A0A2R5L4D9_9ACAR
MNVSFAGCGFLGIYHVGVASALREYASQVCVGKIAGASAGSLAAAALICDVPCGESTTYVLHIAVKARQRALGPFHPGFDVDSIIHEGLSNLLPDNAHKLCSGRLYVSLTRISDGKNVLISQFDTKEELIQVLKCSCFIPFYSGLFPPKINGVAYVDGGFSDNLPNLDENTITVSPFAGESDICPIDDNFNLLQINLCNTSITLSPGNLYRFTRILFPPNPEILSRMCKQGFDDAVRFLQKQNMISCTRCLAVQSSLVMADSNTESESDSHPFDDCNECKERQQLALTESLPDAIVKALQHASDQLDKGVINWLFRHRPMKFISFLTIPYVLPIDITIVVCCKLWQLLPKLQKEMQTSLYQLLNAAKNIVTKFQDTKGLHNAKFSCQLALTEFNYSPNEPVAPRSRQHTPARSMQPSTVAAPNKPSEVTKLFEQRSRSLENIAAAVPDATPPCPPQAQRKSYAGLSFQRAQKDTERVIGTMNFGFTMSLSQLPRQVKGRSDSRTSVIESLRKLEDPTENLDAIKLTNQALDWERECLEQAEPHNVDEFDEILRVTQDNEALMAYYYTDDEDGHERVRVTEIFSVNSREDSVEDSASRDLGNVYRPSPSVLSSSESKVLSRKVPRRKMSFVPTSRPTI